jgi:hypothetical protein
MACSGTDQRRAAVEITAREPRARQTQPSRRNALGYSRTCQQMVNTRSLSGKTCSTRPVVDHWADGASKSKPLLDGRFEFRNGIWARLLLQQAIANVTGSDRAASCYLYLAAMHVGSLPVTRGLRGRSCVAQYITREVSYSQNERNSHRTLVRSDVHDQEVLHGD